MSSDFSLKDRHGNDIYFGNGGDVWFPQYDEIPDYREHLNKIRHMQMRQDDVILVGYPRSGTHWYNQILHMLMGDTDSYVGNLNDDLIDWHSPDKWTMPDNARLLVSYLRFSHLPSEVRKKKVKVVYTYRNPKDAWVSYYNCSRDVSSFHPYQGTWPQFYDLMMDIGYWYGDWFDHVLSWEKAALENPDIIFMSSYEQMKKDPAGQIQKIDKFLGLNRGKELCEKIADACQISKLRAAKEKLEADDKVMADGASAMYRKGEIGDWKNWFTVAQNEHFDAIFKKRMANSKLPFIFQ